MAWMLSENTVVDLAQALIQFGLNWLVQSSVLICCGLSVAWMLRRHGSAIKSAIYRTTLVMVLVSPLLSWCLSQAGISGWSLELPKSERGHSRESNPTMLYDQFIVASDRDTGLVTRDVDTNVRSVRSGGVADPIIIEESRPSGALIGSATRASADTSLINPRRSEVPHGMSRGWISMVDLTLMTLSLLWISIAACFSIRLAGAWWRLAGIRRRAVTADAETMTLCRTYAAKIGVRAPEVLETPFLPSPCLAGIKNAVVLLPEESLVLSLDDVLIHELAHLLRKDCHWNLLRALTTAIFWFHPLLWVLSRRLEMAAEEVCDDFVVKFGGNREEYAMRLVDVAEFASARVALAGVAMVSFRSMLGHRVTRILDCSRQLSTNVSRTVFLSILLGGFAGITVTGFVGAAPLQHKDTGPNQPARQQKFAAPSKADNANLDRPLEVAVNDAKSSAENQNKKRMAKELNGNVWTIRGQVHKPDGKPATGAKVMVRSHGDHLAGQNPAVAVTTSGTDGLFELSYPKSPLTDNFFFVSAQLEGFGFQVANSKEVNESSELSLKLVPDASVHGKITDLEGKPIEGVSLKVLTFRGPKPGEDLGRWFESVKSGAIDHVSFASLGYYLPACDDDHQTPLVTDREGRFTMSGVGAERLVTLELRGQTIAYQKIEVVTRAMPPMTRNAENSFAGTMIKGVVLGMDFTYPAQPTQVIEGTVRDAKTKQGVPGVIIESEHLAGTVGYRNHVLRTQTDSEGRYRLVGMPKGDDNVIQVFSEGETAYQLRHIKAPKSSNAAFGNFDIEMIPGLWITGKVTDKATGKPVKAVIKYLPFLDNPFTKKRPEFHDENMDHSQFHYSTDADGNYRIPGLPGRAIVAASSQYWSYRKGNGAEKIKGLTDKGEFETYRQVGSASPSVDEALVEINPAEDSKSVTCDLQLDPGATIRVTFVDPEGNPVEGTNIIGRLHGHHDLSQPSTIDVSAMTPNETRTIQVVHKQRQLGKVFDITYDGQKTDPVTITLLPTATIKGRLVDQDGIAVKNTGLMIDANFKAKHRTGVFNGGACNPDGTFEFSALPTGCESYSLRTLGGIMQSINANIVVQPGQVVDLGDVKLKK